MTRSGFTSRIVRITSSNWVTSPRKTGAPMGTSPNPVAAGLRAMPTTVSPRATSRRMRRGPRALADGRGRRVHGAGLDVLHPLAGPHVGRQHADPHGHGALRGGSVRLAPAGRAGRPAHLAGDGRGPGGRGDHGLEFLRAGHD